MLVSVQQDWFVCGLFVLVIYSYSLGTPWENNYSRLPCEVFLKRSADCNDHTANLMLLFSFKIALKCKQSCRDQACALSLALILGYNARNNPLMSVIVQEKQVERQREGVWVEGNPPVNMTFALLYKQPFTTHPCVVKGYLFMMFGFEL